MAGRLFCVLDECDKMSHELGKEGENRVIVRVQVPVLRISSRTLKATSLNLITFDDLHSEASEFKLTVADLRYACVVC